MKRDPEGSFVLASDAGTRNIRADALTDDRRQALGEAISEYFGKLDSDEGVRAPEGRILRTFDYCDSRNIDDLIDRAIVPALTVSPVKQPAAAPIDGDREFHIAAVQLVNDMMDAWQSGIPYRSVSGGIHARINALLTAPIPDAAAPSPADELAAFEAWYERTCPISAEALRTGACDESIQESRDEMALGFSAGVAYARAAASPAAEARAEIVSKIERMISAVNAYTGIGGWYAEQIQGLCSSLLKTLAAQQPAQVATKASHEIVAEQQRTHEFVQFADRTRYVASIDPNAGVGPYPQPMQADAPFEIDPPESGGNKGRLPALARTREGHNLYSLGYSRGRKKGREEATQADASAEAVDSDGLTPRADLERDPLWQWRCIANEAEIVVNRKGKFLMLSEEMCVRLGSALEDSAPAEAREPAAWVTPDGDRAITQAQKQAMLRDGGASASSVRPYSIRCYADSAPADAAEAVAIVEVGGMDHGPFTFQTTPHGVDTLPRGIHSLYTAQPAARVASLLDHFIVEYGHLLAQRLKLVYYDIADRDAQLRALLNGADQ
ncbi:hypothetical protein WI86_13735 [Burkholderia ubonensis]|nr:hypothetical protein WI86_13735 [Burkholderia ubonensis]